MTRSRPGKPLNRKMYGTGDRSTRRSTPSIIMLIVFYRLALTLSTYYRALITYTCLPCAQPRDCPLLHRRCPYSALWVFSLARTPHLWGKRHYRATSFGADIRANLRNVAMPGTGIAMHRILYGPISACLFLVFIYPLIALASAAYLTIRSTNKLGVKADDGGERGSSWAATQCGMNDGHASLIGLPARFEELLLRPRHWFAIWRLNCFLVAWHAMRHSDDEAISRCRGRQCPLGRDCVKGEYVAALVSEGA